MEGETIDLVYKTFTDMMHHESHKIDRIDEMMKTINPNSIYNFTVLQIMGLILLKPEPFRRIFNDFEEKRRKMGSVSASLKTVKVNTRY